MNSSDSRFKHQALPAWRRAVLKVGSSLLAAEGEGLTPRHALGLARFVSDSLAAGREVVIVSSGAVAAGRAVIHRQANANAVMAERQALAAPVFAYLRACLRSKDGLCAGLSLLLFPGRTSAAWRWLFACLPAPGRPSRRP